MVLTHFWQQSDSTLTSASSSSGVPAFIFICMQQTGEYFNESFSVSGPGKMQKQFLKYFSFLAAPWWVLSVAVTDAQEHECQGAGSRIPVEKNILGQKNYLSYTATLDHEAIFSNLFFLFLVHKLQNKAKTFIIMLSFYTLV